MIDRLITVGRACALIVIIPILIYVYIKEISDAERKIKYERGEI